MKIYLCQADAVGAKPMEVSPLELTTPVLVMRRGDEIIATAGLCPHEQVALVDGDIVDHRIVCPAHGYQFDLTTGQCAHDPHLRLARYRVTVENGAVWIALPTAAIF